LALLVFSADAATTNFNLARRQCGEKSCFEMNKTIFYLSFVLSFRKKTSITLGRENILNSKREDPSLLVNKKKLTYKNIVGRGKTKN